MVFGYYNLITLVTMEIKCEMKGLLLNSTTFKNNPELFKETFQDYVQIVMYLKDGIKEGI